ncbi:MAG: glycoside hydrolase family 3 N-terminal domain-containing protein [Acidimicrobiales bacterium]
MTASHSRRGIGRFAPVLAALLLAGCSQSAAAQKATEQAATEATDRPLLQSETTVIDEPAPGSPTAATTPAPTAPGRAEEILAGLSLEQKVGQLLMPVLAGRAPAEVTREEQAANRTATGLSVPAEIVNDYHLGGVIYLAKNIGTADQVDLLSAGLQQAARADSGVGLLVAVDQEGGRVNRITDGVTVFPSAEVLSGDAAAVREAGYLTGRQVADLGINVVLAPVADVTRPDMASFISNRSYGNDPQIVSQMVTASVDGLQDAGVAAAVKHWPGHGGTDVDSHLELPVLDSSREAWDQRERVPFQAAIEHRVSIVLVGHLAVPSLDPSGSPATVSPAMIDGLLRTELGFDGVVMTDALNMGAVEDIEPGRLAVQAILAGVDILLVPPDLGVAYRAITSAVERGEISPERLDQSVLRILRLKERLGQL